MVRQTKPNIKSAKPNTEFTGKRSKLSFFGDIIFGYILAVTVGGEGIPHLVLMLTN